MNLIELSRALHQLRLGGMAAVLETRLRQAQAEAMAPIDLISCLVSDELTRRTDRLLDRRRKQARFRDPDRTLDNFDFTFNPKMNRSLVFDLATGAFINKREDALFRATAHHRRLRHAQAAAHGRRGPVGNHHAPLRTLQHTAYIQPSSRGLGQTAGRCRRGECNARSLAASWPRAQVRSTKLAHEDGTGIVRKKTFLVRGPALALPGFSASRQPIFNPGIAAAHPRHGMVWPKSALGPHPCVALPSAPVQTV